MAIPLTKELLTSDAEKLAHCFCKIEQPKEGSKQKPKKNSSSQIRKFYDDFVLLKAKADRADEEKFKKNILPLIYFSKAKITYSVARNLMTEELKNKIIGLIEKVDSKEDFDNFVKLFEAMICYATYMNDSNNNSKNGSEN